ncbi:predicted protein [Scheffersomyces stipitis CBS 6054]|uniref:Pyridoxamine 5'-phosphate oxidase Alr4036 family FMN-binding domain-containing protein n=1 Tax=Scheffersomyces stipitis (strain ATCC 58785 / CBS 6054 / NBRC 10063 / NRRL Y-11545) TaxID=322104 RepID=A3LSL6_PICST|nr:predicted protein [Scheffersomyces stipitis CBS 6054]ABN65591.2 predicted protein [Scheffersomyces stipitis CBS 6054]
MLQFHYMAPWVPGFTHAVEAELIASENKPPFTPFQLATIDSKTGFPKNRTLVYRGFLFDDKSNSTLTFTTDKRMDKYDELLHNDRFEAVFYFGRTKKQFRFSGRARIIDDAHRPSIDLASIQPSTLIENNHKKSLKRAKEYDNSDSEYLDLLSPSLLSQFNNDSTSDLAYSTLNELSHLSYIPPTDQEWSDEIERQWNGLSKGLKKSFRKPSPLTPLTDEHVKLMDSINRGVDGKKDDHGKKNFAVVAMFIDRVDLVELDKDRRYIYVKDPHQLWSEEEVCP